MRFLVGGLALTLLAIAIAGRGAEGVPAQAGKCVSIEVVLADAVGPVLPAASNAAAPAEITAERIQELEREGKLDSLARVRFATLEHCPGMVQFGERVPVVTQQFSGPRSPDGGGGGGTTSYSMENVGTKVQVMPRVEQDGAIVLELQVERSRLVGRPGGAETQNRDASAFVPHKIVTVMAESTIRIVAGKTVAIEARESSAKEKTMESRQTWILATAKVLDAK
jgi:type II secretory pathway component GspD/PulD (secretin)